MVVFALRFPLFKRERKDFVENFLLLLLVEVIL
nr:MAG TPA: hypothetical protein [Caudoviricetes sp.]DAZ45014.1 MAG TPA: hypothetical protein [Caudoviricetes sp.]